MRGKTISIYLPDGDPKGVKICEITDSIVKAVAVPRNLLESALKRKELQDPGVYFLFGQENELGKIAVYIGKAEVLATRLRQHNAGKDFWKDAVCFISEKKNINKAHIKYLENYCCEQSKKIGKCSLENGVTPTQASLTEQDTDFVLSFYDDLKVLLGTLGYRFLEEDVKNTEDLFICKGKGAFAEGEYSSEGMVIFKGSTANIEESKTIAQSSKKVRKQLVQEGILVQQGNYYQFTQNFTFSSPSLAADVVLGRSANGWTEWKSKEGKTLSDRYRL